jgi:superoxide dismutase
MKKIILSCFLICLINSIYAQTHTLPKLKFEYNAYEPFIDSQTMTIHHSKHHQGYVNKLNKAIAGTPAEKMSLIDLNISISAFNTNIRNNAGGHYNHTLFWEILSPKQDGQMSKAFRAALKSEFNHLDSLKKELNQAASTRFGSGWAWLIVTPDKKLKVVSTANQDNPLMDISEENGIPIIAIDVWEHAYYLKYQNKRGDYLGSIWSLLDWGVISDKYEAAIQSPVLEQLKANSWKSLNLFKAAYANLKSDTPNSTTYKENSMQLIQAIHVLNASSIPASIEADKVKPILVKMDEVACDLNQSISNAKQESEILALLAQIGQFVEKLDAATK